MARFGLAVLNREVVIESWNLETLLLVSELLVFLFDFKYEGLVT